MSSPPKAAEAAHGPQEGAGPERYRLDAQVGYLLRLANQRHTMIFQDRAILGLTPAQFSTLVRLADTGPCSQNRLGRLVAVDVATIKGVVDRLRMKGLVELAKDPTDRRRTLISLSPAGREAIAGLHAMGREVTTETLAPLPPGERGRFLDFLRKLT